MRIRSVASILIGAVAALFISVQPAAAQGKTEFAVGYQFLRFIDDGGNNVPAGWGASVAGAINDMFKVVGDIGGHYKDGNNLHTFQGGVEVAGKNAKTTPFFRILAGLARFGDDDGDSSNVFAVTPEVGVKIKGSGRVGGQVAVGFPIFRDNGETDKSFRLFLGITIQ